MRGGRASRTDRLPKPGVAGGIRPGRGRVAVVTRAAKKGGSKLTPEERRARREARERREAEEAELAAFEAEEAARLAAGGVEDDLDGFHAGDDAGFDETVAEVGDEQLEELEEEEEEEEEEVRGRCFTCPTRSADELRPKKSSFPSNTAALVPLHRPRKRALTSSSSARAARRRRWILCGRRRAAAAVEALRRRRRRRAPSRAA